MIEPKPALRRHILLLTLLIYPLIGQTDDGVPPLGPLSNPIQNVASSQTAQTFSNATQTHATTLSNPINPDHQTIGINYGLLSAAPGTPLIGQGNGRSYGFEISSYRGNHFFQILGRTRFSYGLGKAIFTDDEDTQQTLNFRLFSGEVLLGVRLNLVHADYFSLLPYFGVAGKLALNSLSIPEVSTTSTTLAPSMTGKTMGVEFLTGFEFERIFFIEFQLRSGTGSIGGISIFQLDGAALSVGFMW